MTKIRLRLCIAMVVFAIAVVVFVFTSIALLLGVPFERWYWPMSSIALLFYILACGLLVRFQISHHKVYGYNTKGE